MTPISPMLAKPCNSIKDIFKKNLDGIYSEIKYDGERIQIHKSFDCIKYYSRNLKPILDYKIQSIEKYILKAFNNADNFIIDGEIILVDENGKLLPFGSLGIKKQKEFKNSTICLFVFDCIYFNNKDLKDEPLYIRKQILIDNMIEIKNHIMFCESKLIYNIDELKTLIIKIFKEGHEGLVLKPKNSIYEPNKRYWLKIKKDYLLNGKMIDTVDLIVLGAWYGTGKKGGLMSTFLMGCYDEEIKKFKMITKVHNGIDDKTLLLLQNKLNMVKIDKNNIPDWLILKKNILPNFITNDPFNQPIWEIIGAEFILNDNNISIRFPRVLKIRDDKTFKESTKFSEIKLLCDKSKNLFNETLMSEL